MIIAIDASRANRPHKTGTEWYAYNIIQGLKKADSSNRYFLYTDRPLEGQLAELPPNFCAYRLRWPFGRGWNYARLGLALAQAKPEIFWQPAHNFPFVGGQSNIITWHDLAYEYYPELYSDAQLRSLRQGVRQLRTRADKIITVSDHSKNDIVTRYQIPASKIEVIHLGINNYLFRPYSTADIEAFKKRRNIEQPYFVSIGRLEDKKNITNLILAFNEYKNKGGEGQLRLLGSPGFGYETIRRTIDDSSYKQEIIEEGYIPQSELPLFMAAATALIHPSYYEGFGLTVVEAQAVGCPVLCSVSGSLPEVTGGQALFFQANDYEEIAANMDTVSAQPDESLIHRGIENARRFTWEAAVKKTLAVFEQALKKERQRGSEEE
ncbi:MAG: glycosyltransferase family 4 protein [Candidatus Komeilibacteria bacterium]|nr:glycosyltransferase family 4 protein [Candidatus Komeilibacteria bacterium]